MNIDYSGPMEWTILDNFGRTMYLERVLTLKANKTKIVRDFKFVTQSYCEHCGSNLCPDGDPSFRYIEITRKI